MDARQWGIVAHDAGAANHIIHWLLAQDIQVKTEHIILQGPAQKLAKEHGIKYTHRGLEALVNEVDVLLVGSGWGSELEKNAMFLGLKNNKKVICVFDHWTNFKQRLSYQQAYLQVDEIWVTDTYAYELAKQQHPNISVLKKNNVYLEQSKAAIIQKSAKLITTKQLFLMEPIRQPWYKNQQELGEFLAFKFFIKNRHLLGLADEKNIMIRPHPSDEEAKYQQLQSLFPLMNIEISKNTHLFDDIAQSNWVFGMQSYAMVIALAAGKTVVSCLPPNAPSCVLPHTNLLHLRDI